VFLLEATPPPPIRASAPFELLRLCKAKFWFDQETLALVRREAELREDFRGLGKGTKLLLETTRVEGVHLPRLMLIEILPETQPNGTASRKKPRQVTEQALSEYRRFGAEVRVIDEPEP
jgi:hypothetical protein